MSFFESILSDNSKANHIIGLTNEMKGIYIYKTYIEQKESLLVVTNTIYDANNLYKIIQKYTQDVLLFPMDDFLTSEALAISPEFKNTRLETITDILISNKIVITNLMGYLRYLPLPSKFKESVINLKVNDDYNIKKLIEDLSVIGYTRETIVTKTGEMGIRGFVIDVFPITEKNPIRIEYWGDTIESIRTFNVESQMTIDIIKKINIYPNTEFLVDSNIQSDYKYLYQYTKITNIYEYLENKNLMFINYNDIFNGYNLLLDEINNYNELNNLNEKYMNEFSIPKRGMVKYLEDFDNNIDSVKDTLVYKTYDIDAFPKNIKEWNNIFDKYLKNNKTIVICLSNRYQINKILDEIEHKSFVITNEQEIFDNKINIIIKPITNGFIYDNYIVISEKELFSKNSKIQYKSNFKIGTKIRNINKLSIGDYIVHSTHGVGRYIGIKSLVKNGLRKDYLTIEYKDGDKLYIPVEKMEFITKYSSNEGITPKINKLGTTEWEKTKLRVKKKLEDIAGKLLSLYASREATQGFSFDKDTEEQMEFEKQFPYNETEDQLKVVEEIKNDMEKARPMDRLLCGDVGYGKTEVAFRAMFKAVLSNKQVALLCPTTILSNQHYQNAMDRFKEFPINIILINRFVNPKNFKKYINDINDGKIDIVIGTHKLLSSEIVFKDLGLLVIDEEQRFGVKHKEKIKEYKNNIDVLTLSATPIPRTLQMSMAGIRNLSLIETPPINRYPIQTYVLEENNQIIKDAIYKELSRGGQVFILFNHVADMENKLNELQRLVPDAKIISAHGRLTKNEIENVMIKFIDKEYDVLLCTTIIETGIDIPNVNTLLIIDADRFGLSQLYQIRGRVGRSDKIAYCYLMYHKGKSLSDIATKRLKVIKDFTELGSGFAIAMRDLSIRGAGDILGNEQAGFIDSIGIELYLKMLEEEVNKQKGVEIKSEVKEDERPLLEVETYIDDNYVEETELKIEIHKKINQIENKEDINETKSELEDRFGKISDSIIIYMYEEWFEKIAKELNIKKIRQTNNFIEITIPRELTENINGENLFIEANKISRMFRFSMKLKQLVITLDIVKLDKHFIYYLIDLLEVIKSSIKK